ncbi:hypothetical protein BC749_10928 [Flavobacterium araucananum]|uniref:Uncharacterized protein n=1 Tax=Flavobacterium araucananum TaxID=946678 RepID=A0A227P158_9FLAO|nr:hypothetical protein [Flavobacterium araucananum]OXG03687.1 hypothetical protein B0A64_17025 [Flavobacterium araucananum]PWJ96752.1 hypothetical protein BC749_10928 [Flavobacterium araucananum]
MYTTFNIFEKILSILAQNPQRDYTLEDLTNLFTPYFTELLQEDLSMEIINQAKVLEALIVLDCKGLIILDSDSDKSIISMKGLINITSTSFLN